MPWKAASGVGSLARPRTGHRSIRGHISGPIPIPAPTADRADDELPMRDPVAAAAVAWHGNEATTNGAPAGSREPGRRQRQHPVDVPFTDSSRADSLRADAHQEARAFADTSHPAQDHQPDSAVHSDTNHARSPMDGPNRKKSTFRSALSRLLGRSKKGSLSHVGGDSLDKSTPAEASAQHHRSDPIGDERPPKTVETKRSASLPITEYDRALRSHSVGPQDVLAIQSARNSLNAEARTPTKRSGASDTASTHLAPARRTEARRSTGLGPRPASSHDRRPRLTDWIEDPSEIGWAITSDAKGLKRRSRSLSAFPSTEGAFTAVTRRRSDEIRHWRESYNPASSMPCLADEAEDAAILATDAPDVTGRPRSSIPPFIFGGVPSVKEASGLKITEAASLDSRVSTLEARMSRLEQIVAGLAESLAGSVPPTDHAAAVPPPAEHGGARESTLAPEGDEDAASGLRHPDATRTMFGGDGITFLDITPRATMMPRHPSPDASRPLSLATVCGAVNTSSVPRNAADVVTTDHYLTLVTLLETERSAREMLESQVRRLGHQVRLATKLGGHAHTGRCDFSAAEGSLGGTSAFDHDDDDDDDDDDDHEKDLINGGARHSPGSFGALPVSSSTMWAHHEDEDDEEEGYTESYATPNEDGDRSAAGDEDHDVASKTAARALSLSRLTLGAPQPSPHQLSPQAI
ncbi:hypothetical protein CDD83_2235 [Cordyceps sp. RAO-2017]|nr:hypothetical protein CDD83_2235 [Cordyceps sp. RAO-2017]